MKMIRLVAMMLATAQFLFGPWLLIAISTDDNDNYKMMMMMMMLVTVTAQFLFGGTLLNAVSCSATSCARISQSPSHNCISFK